VTRLRGIVIKTQGRWMWVATEDRRFMRFPLPRQGVKPGQEIWVTPSRAVTLSLIHRRLLLVASLLIVLFFGATLARILYASPVAYLALDINPSLELAVNSSGRVAGILPLNQDSQLLLEDLPVRGKDIYESLGMIIRESEKAGYISPEKENLVLLTVVFARPKDNLLDTGRIKEVVLSPMAQAGMRGKVGIQTASLEEREKARQAGLSLNSYLIIKKASLKALPLNLLPQSTPGVEDIVEKLAAEGVNLEQLVDNVGVTYPGTSNDNSTNVRPKGTPAGYLPGKVSEGDPTVVTQSKPGKKIPENQFPTGSEPGSSEGNVSNQVSGPVTGMYEPDQNGRNSKPLTPSQKTDMGSIPDNKFQNAAGEDEMENETEIVPRREEDEDKDGDSDKDEEGDGDKIEGDDDTAGPGTQEVEEAETIRIPYQQREAGNR